MEPTLTFIYNHSAVDTEYNFYTGNPNWRELTPGSDVVIITGGGIDDADTHVGDFGSHPTLASGTRSPTIRPSVTSYIIPYVYVESGNTMYSVPLCSNQGSGNTSKYVFGISVSGTINGNAYLEAFDNNSFSSYDLPVLSGTNNSSYESYVQGMNTLWAENANGGTVPYPWSGSTTGCSFLRGQSDRVSLGYPNPVTEITDTVLYYKFYIRLETDSPTFHNVPVFAVRYLYS